MNRFFLSIYTFLQTYRVVFYTSLVVIVSLLLYFAVQLKFEENVNQFFPDKINADLNIAFNDLRIKDKIIVMFSETGNTKPDPDMLIENATLFKDTLWARCGDSTVKQIFLQADQNSIKEQFQGIIYQNLATLLTDDDYIRFDSLLTPQGMGSVMARNYSNLLSPAGAVMKEYIKKDPLGLASNSLKHLEDFRLSSNFQEINGCFFSENEDILFMYITPVYGLAETAKNNVLIKQIEGLIKEFGEQHPEVTVEYYGGPSVAVYNARQIKDDSILTLSIALIVILAFILLLFKQVYSIFQLLCPVIFGGLFAVAMVYLLKGSISSIAMGSASIVLGIALSYSIHMVLHQSHVNSVEQLIKELAYPMTVGSITTIGAFIGLLFTNSSILRDFGLFASLSLVGTILFCLIYLPHFLDGKGNHKKTRLLTFIERFNSYPFEKNKWLIGIVLLLTVVSLFTMNRVGFDADMMKINYEPEHLKEAERKVANIVEADKQTVIFVSRGDNYNTAINNYAKVNEQLETLKQEGLVNDFATATFFLKSIEEQEKNIERWNNYWTKEKKERLHKLLTIEAEKYNFRQGTFQAFFEWFNTPFEVNSGILSNTILNDWVNITDNSNLLITQVQLDKENKEEVYEHFSDINETLLVDRSFITTKWISAINDDFDLVLWISSSLIFVVLLLSYGRLELTLISFAPLCLAWIIIVGFMGAVGLQFNIVTVILSAFIFGLGDDFSIFVVDGVQKKYRSNKPVLSEHKTAIFCSAFTMLVGLGVLFFAKHPAMQSISLLSVVGMIVVVLISYIVPPLLFKLLITSQTDKGNPPYTLFYLFSTLLVYIVFMMGCLCLQLLMFFLLFTPTSKKARQNIVARTLTWMVRFICNMVFFIKIRKDNFKSERFSNPSIIIANHQSFLDILLLLSVSHKIILATNKWVWNSPFFGRIIRYLDYYCVEEGYEKSLPHFEKKIAEGYSIVIYPEGTRSPSSKLKRFHKGAFYLAEALKVDITPVVMYGTGMVISKDQPFYLKPGEVVMKCLGRIAYSDHTWGEDYRSRAKKISSYFATEYFLLSKDKNTPLNPYFAFMLIKNFTYKGPVEEWYVRIKARMEAYYKPFTDLIPADATVVDIGCGYGMLCFMLSMISPTRNVMGIDYDEEKIEVANNSFLKKDNLSFVCADAIDFTLPGSDVFVLNDILHYTNYENQEKLITQCAIHLKEDGMIIIRDGDENDMEKQKMTKLSEVFSTKLLGFNKTDGELCFTSSERIEAIANSLSMNVESFRNDKITSNTIFILRRKQ